jgi:autotransporter-associated beta strand protein
MVDLNSNNVTFGSALSGPGMLTKVGAGTLTLSVANPTLGGLVLGGGTTVLSNANQIGNPASAKVTFLGGQLQFATGFTADISGQIAAVASGSVAQLIPNNQTITFGTSISGAGGLISSGAGTVILSSANTFTGIAGVANNGTLRLSAAGSSAGQYALNVGMLTHQQGAGTLGGSIDWYGNEQVNPAAVYAWSSGTSSLLNLRGFTQTLGGLVSSGGTAMAVQNNLTATAATLILDVPVTRAPYFNSIIRNQLGTLALVKRGEGTQVIDTAAVNLAYTGGTTVEAGTLEFRQAVPARTDFTVSGGTLAVGTINPVSGNISTLDLRGGRVTGPGNLRVTAPLTPRAGIFDKDVSTPLSFTKISDGTPDGGILTVTSALTVGQGVATVSGGTLKVGSGGTTGQLNAAQIVNNGAVIFDRSNDFNLDAQMTGSGSFQKAGLGVMTVRAPIEVSGPTSITGGTLRLATASTAVTAPVAGASLWF